MKILVVGGTGLIGSAVVQALKSRYEVVAVSRSTADLSVDIASVDSVREFFARAGAFDALVSAAGSAAFRKTPELSDEDFAFSVQNKLLGQINLVRYGLASIRQGGSFTLTSGILAREPIPGSAAVSMVNGALECFARAAALDIGRNIRINVVSPPWAAETLAAMKRDTSTGVPVAEFVPAYLEAVGGSRTGEVLDVRQFR